MSHVSTCLNSLKATHVPGDLNQAADLLSQQVMLRGVWKLHPQVVHLIWSRIGEAQANLFAFKESSHCPLWYTLIKAPLGRDALGHSWPGSCSSMCLPQWALSYTVQDQGGRRTSSILAQPDLDIGAHADGVRPSLAIPPEEGSLEPPCLVPGRDEEGIQMLRQEPPLLDVLIALKWLLSLHGFLPEVKTHGDVVLGQCYPSSKKA